MCIVEGDSDDEFVDSDAEQANANGADASTRFVHPPHRAAASMSASAATPPHTPAPTNAHRYVDPHMRASQSAA